jgi:hypothetical protein
MSKQGDRRLTKRWMSSLWRSRIQNTQDVVGPTGWYRGNLLRRETLPPIEAVEEEESEKRRSGAKRYSKDLKNMNKA